MRVEHLSDSVTLYLGDCLDVLARLDECSIDACVTDPPYHLTANKNGGSGVASVNLDSPYGRARIGTGNGAGGFMGKAWDGGDIAFQPDTWRAVLRVLKPGAHLLAFGGTRTFARMSVAIEDAGFEIRDTVMWLYGSGFPKSHDVSKAIDKAAGAERVRIGRKDELGVIHGQGDARSTKHEGWARPWMNDPDADAHFVTAPATDTARQWSGFGTALKPACEPIVLARKPLEGTVAQNVLKWGTGALNIDGCRVATDWSERPDSWKRSGHSAKPDADKIAAPPGNGINCHEQGRWPANVILSVPEDEYQLRGDVTPDQRRELFRWMSENA